jgi:hypothetical protein
MKKNILSFIITILGVVQLSAQIVINPSSVGIGENTLSSIPFHIKSYDALVSRINSPKVYFNLSQYANPAGTTNTIYTDNDNEAGALKFKSASNIFTFYTLDQEQARLDLNINRFTVQKEVTFEGDISFGGRFLFYNYAGVSGDLMASLGSSGSPAWSAPVPKVPVGYAARKDNSLTIPNATDTDFTDFFELYDHEASLNFFPVSGAFIAPSDGVYHFECTIPEITYSSSITNGRATLYVKKNNVIVDTILKSFSGYGSNNQTKISMQINITLKLLAGDSVKFGMTQVNNLSASISIPTSLLYKHLTISGFKVY